MRAVPCLGERQPALLDDLLDQCRKEKEHFRAGGCRPSPGCMTLVQYAVIDGRDDAWAALVGLYGEVAATWCRLAGASTDVEEFANLAWTRVWRWYTPEKLARAADIGDVLQYLKMCAYTVVADAYRRGSAPEPVRADNTASSEPGPDAAVIAAEHRALVWKLVREQLRNERERVFVELRYVAGLRPQQILAQRPDLFPTATAVYQTGRNILHRLRRSQALKRLAARRDE
jgi:hypothetical protein